MLLPWTIYSNNCREREIVERHEATGVDIKIDLCLLSKDRRIETGGFLEREREILSAVEADLDRDVGDMQPRVGQQEFRAVNPKARHVFHNRAAELALEQRLQIAAVDAGGVGYRYGRERVLVILLDIRRGASDIDKAARIFA